MSEDNSFVRKEMISERIPPAAERGLVKWFVKIYFHLHLTQL